MMKNEGSLDTHRGASEASRAGGTRLTTVSLEEKEANWRDALTWGRWAGHTRGTDEKEGPGIAFSRDQGVGAKVEEG